MATAKDQRAEQQFDIGENLADLERQDLLSGEARYIEDEIRNTNLSLVAAIWAVIFAITAMVMTWVICYRERTRTWIWHGVWLAGAILFGLICAAWAWTTKSQVASGKPPNNYFTGFVFVMSFIFVGYLLIEAIWLVLYRPIHFNYLVGISADPAAWSKYMPDGKSFTDGWIQDRRIIWWIIFLTVALALCFAFIAFAARSVVWNKFAFTKLALYTALIFMTLAGWLVIYWVTEAYALQSLMPTLFNSSLLGLAKALAIIAIVLAFINAVLAMLQIRLGLFVIAALEIVLVIILICVAGTILRNVGTSAFTDVFEDGNCLTTLGTIHENNIGSVCPLEGSKYLPVGSQCSKSLLVTRWEGNNELRSLNPNCCASAKYFYLYPFLYLGYWLLVLIFATAVAIACNCYIAESNEYLRSSNLAPSLIDFVGIGIIAVLSIAWGIYFLARTAKNYTSMVNNSAASYLDPLNNKIAGFDPVPEGIKNSVSSQAAASFSDGCIAYNTSKGPSLAFSTSTNSTYCTDSKTCYDRLAILALGSTLKITNNGGASQGSISNRLNFFPGCTSSSNDYLFYYGTTSQLQTLLSNLRICPKTPGASSAKINVYHDQVTKAQTTMLGQLWNESNATTTLTASDAGTCGTGFATYSGNGQCVGNCSFQVATAIQQLYYTVVGRLYTIQNGVANYSIHNQVNLQAFNKYNQIGGNFVLYQNGLFSISDIPRDNYTNWDCTLSINDPTGVFLPKRYDFLVPRDTGADSTISAGLIRLDTKDGTVCNETDTTCINNQKFKSGSITISVRDGTEMTTNSSTPGLPGATVNLQRWNQLDGPLITTQQTGGDGATIFSNLNYDSYALVVNKSGYVPDIRYVDLQEVSNQPVTVILYPLNNDFDARVSAVFNNPNADFDLNLMAQSDKGTTCTTNPYNKYCAYANHVNDVAFGQGIENILVRKLSVASYMSWISPASAYSASCPQSAALTNVGLYHAQDWNWDTFKQTNPLYLTSLDVETFGNNGGADVVTSSDIFGRLVGLLNKQPPVESSADAATCKTVINLNGTPASKPYTGCLYTNSTSSSLTSAAPTPIAISSVAAANLPSASPVSSASSAAFNYLMTSCFTGFGQPSIIETWQYSKDLPQMSQCTQLIQNFRPQFSASSLRSVVG